MNSKIQLKASGIPLVDEAWGGFYKGGTYLLIGARKSGRTLLSLQYAMECANQKDVCLYFTSMRPKDLMIQAASIDLDIQKYMNQNLIIVVRVAPPADLYELGNSDSFLVEYMNDIVTVVEQYKPNRIVFDELTPFVGFNDLSLLQQSFSRTSEAIEDYGITSLYVIGEPAEEKSQAIVDCLSTNSTGVIHLEKTGNEKIASEQSGIITITPNIGHTEGQFTSEYRVEPYKGIVVNYEKPKSFEVNVYSPQTTRFAKKYKSLAEVDIPQEDYSFISYYNENEFKLILNNQIALFKSTGQVFTLISFRLDKIAEDRGLLSITQLQNAIRLATDKKDKICIINNDVVVLIIKEDQKSIDSLIGKVKANLPISQSKDANELLRHISVYIVKVDEQVQSADDLLQLITAEESEEKNKLYFH